MPALTLLVFCLSVGALNAVRADAGPRRIGAGADLEDLILVKTTVGKAVVRFGAGPLELVSVDDRLGRTGARVKEIGGGRLVLEESFTGADGKPNAAQVVLKDGEKGGTRYLQRPDEQPVPVYRPKVTAPAQPGRKPPPSPAQNEEPKP